jgi:hypothetical protein
VARQPGQCEIHVGTAARTGTRPAQTKPEPSAAESLDVDGKANCLSGLDGWRWSEGGGIIGGCRDAFEVASQQGKLKLFRCELKE